MSEPINVSGVRLTAEQVAWLDFVWGDAPNFYGNDDGIEWDIQKAVWAALPVGTP